MAHNLHEDGTAFGTPPPPPPSPFMSQRQFLDSHGHAWIVWDVLPSRVARELDAAWLARHGITQADESLPARSRASLPTQFEGGWLCFERAGEKRRLAPVPRGWELLTSAELEVLCGGAALVGARVKARSHAEIVREG